LQKGETCFQLAGRRAKSPSLSSSTFGLGLEKHLHIVSFDVPFPPDYGGIIPIFSLIKNLHQEGIVLHLHCFEYGRGHQPELNKYCKEVKYYERREGIKGFSFRLPYIVSSRVNAKLRAELLKDDFPILFEGIHCSYLLLDEAFANRRTGLRLHNVEFAYYMQLFRTSSDFLKRWYYYFESKLLKRYEARIARNCKIITMSAEDAVVYNRQLKAISTIYMPMIIPFTEIKTKPGRGQYCLYHGNLSVSENEKAASWLITDVFNKLDIPLVIAGKHPGERLKKLAASNANVQLVADPSDEEMFELIQDAQINVLPSFNSTGVKLKLLNALFNGRHCVVNAAMGCGTEMVFLFDVADDGMEFRTLIRNLFNEAFSEEEIGTRKEVLFKIFDNPTNTRSLVQWIYSHYQ
jgi:glycosyltransferase involved in cell wall biosynthesis